IAEDFRLMPAPKPSLTEADLEAARRRALERRPEVRTAHLRVTQAEYDWKMQRAAWIPDVSLMLNYMRFANFAVLIPKDVASFGIYFQWDVFDWGRRNRQTHEKEKAVQQLANQAVETDTATRIEVGRLHRHLAESLRALEAADLTRAAAHERL